MSLGRQALPRLRPRPGAADVGATGTVALCGLVLYTVEVAELAPLGFNASTVTEARRSPATSRSVSNAH
jgi:hypothetical protein